MKYWPAFDGSQILIVEDDPIQALDLSSSFEDAGASILGPAATLDEAIRITQAARCDAAIVDYGLGRQNSGALVDQLFRSRTPFIVYTGYSDVPCMPLVWRGCRLFSKPAEMGKLIRTVGALVRWKRRDSVLKAARSLRLNDAQIGA